MVYVNDEKALQKAFHFSRSRPLQVCGRKRQRRGPSFEVKPGPAEIKVWLSGKGLRGSLHDDHGADRRAGENKVLRVEYAGGQLAARIQ